MSFDIDNKKIYVLEPVASVIEKSENKAVPVCVSTAVSCLLKEDTDMFCAAETIRDLMVLEGISIFDAAEVLGTDVKTIENKLKLLQLSRREQKYIKNLKYSECTALKLASLCKQDRKAVFNYCKQNGYDSKKANKYVNAFIKTKKTPEFENLHETNTHQNSKAKMPLGFLINSIDRVVTLAKNAGFNVEKSSNVVQDGVEVVIKVKENSKENPTGT